MTAKDFLNLKKLGARRISKNKHTLRYMIMKPQNINRKYFKDTRESKKIIFKERSNRLISPFLLAIIAARR